MFELTVCLGFLGIMCLALAIGYSIFIVIMYAIYKLTNGNMSFREYAQYW